jgi:hypothetical protein
LDSSGAPARDKKTFMMDQADPTEAAKRRLYSARACLRRYAEISHGNQDSALHTRFVRDLRTAAREYRALDNAEPRNSALRQS